MTSDPLHRCSDCGFITLRNASTGHLDEVDEVFRDTGDPPRRRRDEPPGLINPEPLYSTPYWHAPICFAQANDFLEEMRLGPLWRDHDVPGSMIKEVIQRERVCPSANEAKLGFTPWQRGFTPREHREILDRPWRLENDQRIRESVWKREDTRDAEMSRREDARDNESRTRHWRELGVFGGVIAIATVVGGAVDGVVSRGLNLWPF
jgi:hypothetical protein